jgi:hypothetical protein
MPRLVGLPTSRWTRPANYWCEHDTAGQMHRLQGVGARHGSKRTGLRRQMRTVQGHRARTERTNGMTGAPDALERLLRRAENLQPTGTIGNGMVAEFRDLAARVRAEQGRPAPPPPPPATAHASTSPGPVNCEIRIAAQNPLGAVVRSRCARCGIGPCPFFAADGRALNVG